MDPSKRIRRPEYFTAATTARTGLSARIIRDAKVLNWKSIVDIDWIDRGWLQQARKLRLEAEMATFALINPTDTLNVIPPPESN